MRRPRVHWICFCLIMGMVVLLGYSSPSFASSGITYQGRLLAPNGVPVTSSNVQFKMQIRSPGVEDCLLYEEIRTADLSMTSGVFALSVGDGNGTRTDAHGADWNLFETLSNRRDFHFSSGECGAGSSYSPNPTDNRKFRVSFNLGSGWETLPIQVINYIPMSVETYAVGGFPASSLFRVEDAGVIGNVAALTTTQYNNLVDLADGSSSVYEQSGSLNGSTLPSIGSGESVRWNGTSWESYSPLASGDETDPNVEAFAKTSLPTCNTGEVLKSDGSVLSCVTDTSGTLPDVGTAGTYTKVTTDAKGRVTSGDTLNEADLPNITTAGKVSGDAITSGEIAGTTSINTSGNIQTSGDITTTGNLSVSGSATTGSFSTRQFDLYESTNTHKISFLAPSTLSDYTLTFPATAGTSGQVLSTDGSGALSWMNAATGSVTSVTGTSPIVIGGTASAPIVTLSDSGVGAATYGSATQVPVFEVDEKGLIQSVTNTTISGVSPMGSTLSTGKAWIGDGSGKAQEAYINVSDLKKSDGTNQIPFTCTSSQTLNWSSVTDVFLCSDISITTAQVSNFPTLGTAASEDVGIGAGNVVQLDGSGKLPALDGSQLTNLVLPNYDTTYFKQGGNVFSGTATLGTTDNNDLNLITNNTSKMTVTASGNVGIGTTNPFTKLQVENSAIGNTLSVTQRPTITAADTNWDFATSSRVEKVVNAGVVDSGYAQGVQAVGYLNGAGTLWETTGIIGNAGTFTSGTGVVTNAYGGRFNVVNQGGGTITKGFGVYVGDIEATAGYGFYQTGVDDTNYFAGNVGIGTKNPMMPLEVVGTDPGGNYNYISINNTGTNASRAAGLKISDNGSPEAYMTYSHNLAQWKIFAGGGTSADIKMVVNASGEVGIGTISPTGSFEIRKDQDGATRLHLLNSDTGTDAMSTILLGSATTGGTYGFLSYINSGYPPNGIRQPRRTILGGQDSGGLGLLAGNASGNIYFTAGGITDTEERMRITSTGNVGIGTTNPSARLQVGTSGDGSVAIANAWNTFSDIRLKKNITPITNACEMVDHLNGYYYRWKYGKDQGQQIGVIAQEVQRVLPELVKEGPDGILTVDYPKLSAVLIEAVKEMGRKNRDVARKITSLEKENQMIKEALCEINPHSKLCGDI